MKFLISQLISTVCLVLVLIGNVVFAVIGAVYVAILAIVSTKKAMDIADEASRNKASKVIEPKESSMTVTRTNHYDFDDEDIPF